MSDPRRSTVFLVVDRWSESVAGIGTARACIRGVTDALCPLLAGGLVYVLWRPPTLRMFGWAELAGLTEPVTALRRCVGPAPASVPAWLLGALPDAAWVYAWITLLGLVWRTGPARPARTWVSIGPVVGLGSELGQACAVVPGTFCWADLVFMVVATVLGAARVRRWRMG